MKIQRMDHVGVNVNDLEAAKAFFLDLYLGYPALVFVVKDSEAIVAKLKKGTEIFSFLAVMWLRSSEKQQDLRQCSFAFTSHCETLGLRHCKTT
jgi:catechol 2,3-dioxygenase-like lactoylglutathione lyase family enzyme